MTSKAAKKAYLKANRTPKLSRAEQRRLDAEEQARIKEELDRERSAQRAKAARERKAQKEQAQKEARKKMGLPEPNKFVRASQPTISRFVVSGGKRSWQAMDTVAEESDDRGDDNVPPIKRTRVVEDSDEEFGEFPSLSQSDLPALLDNIGTPSKPSERDEAELEQEKLGSSPELPRRRINAEDREEYSLDEGLIDEMVAAQLLSEAVEASSRVDQAPSPEQLPAQSNNFQIFMDEEDDGRDTAQDNDQEALAERSTNLPAPARGTKSITFAPTPMNPHRSAFAEDDNPPSATQMFLENLDDYFPSPSQEIRELREDAEDLPSNTQIAQELNAGASGTEAVDFVGIISTQDFILSSQDLLEITTPSRVLQPRVAETLPAQPQAAPKQKGRFFEEKEDDLLHAALHESKLAAERERQRREPPKKPLGPTKRKLGRTLSVATDYGDEEFSACEKELLELF
jgi:hypothetical protein